MDLPSAKTRRLIIVAMLALAASLFAVAVIVYRGNPSSSDLPVAITSVSPQPNSNVLIQTDILVDLAVGYTADLEVNGFEIPEDQLFRIPALNSLRFEVRDGQIVDRLRADQNCVRVMYWLIAEGPENRQNFDWCFDAS